MDRSNICNHMSPNSFSSIIKTNTHNLIMTVQEIQSCFWTWITHDNVQKCLRWTGSYFSGMGLLSSSWFWAAASDLLCDWSVEVCSRLSDGRRRHSSSSALMATFSGTSQRFRCSRVLWREVITHPIITQRGKVDNRTVGGPVINFTSSAFKAAQW